MEDLDAHAAAQLRNLQSLGGLGSTSTTVVFAAPLMTTIAELGGSLASQKEAASDLGEHPRPTGWARASDWPVRVRSLAPPFARREVTVGGTTFRKDSNA